MPAVFEQKQNAHLTFHPTHGTGGSSSALSALVYSPLCSSNHGLIHAAHRSAQQARELQDRVASLQADLAKSKEAGEADATSRVQVKNRIIIIMKIEMNKIRVIS